jgi:hypothetical protein
MKAAILKIKELENNIKTDVSEINLWERLMDKSTKDRDQWRAAELVYDPWAITDIQMELSPFCRHSVCDSL